MFFVIGRELSVAEQYASVLTISLPVFFFASAGSTIFWIIGKKTYIAYKIVYNFNGICFSLLTWKKGTGKNENN